MKSIQNKKQGYCYPKAAITLLDLHNSSYDTKAEF